jgi:hypothetical protein
MKKTISLFVFLLGILYHGYSQIEGEITDEKNNPLANVLITLTDNIGKTIKSMRTNSKGFYTIDSLVPGKYKIEAKLAGFDNAVKSDIEITKPPANADPHDDTYYAVCVDIILSHTKNKKQ